MAKKVGGNSRKSEVTKAKAGWLKKREMVNRKENVTERTNEIKI